LRYRKSFVVAVATALVLILPSFAGAWNYTGHRIIASIAYRQLDDSTKGRIADVLKKHPAYTDLWVNRHGNGHDDTLNLFWNASLFPDDARREPWRKYGRSQAHYVNHRIMAERGNKVEPPLPGENVVNSYVAHLRRIEDARTSVEDRALHLSWVFHQVQDIHQPLHAVARFSKALPEGDRGGNEVRLPSAEPGSRAVSLHAYWDGLLGSSDDPDTLNRLAGELMDEYPRSAFTEELARKDFKQWAEESADLSLKTMYRDLDPSITRFVDRPVGYAADARRAARRRAALAGYRLADELNSLFRVE
jgi:hypothetical protein